MPEKRDQQCSINVGNKFLPPLIYKANFLSGRERIGLSDVRVVAWANSKKVTIKNCGAFTLFCAWLYWWEVFCTLDLGQNIHLFLRFCSLHIKPRTPRFWAVTLGVVCSDCVITMFSVMPHRLMRGLHPYWN